MTFTGEDLPTCNKIKCALIKPYVNKSMNFIIKSIESVAVTVLYQGKIVIALLLKY